MSFAQSAVDLASRLVWAHEHSKNGRVTVIPVIAEDLTRVWPVVDAFASLTDARILVCGDLTGPVPATSDAIRVASCLRPIDVGSGSARRELKVSIGGGKADATLDPRGGGRPSPGDRELLGVARAVSHAELDGVQVGVLAYREGPLDLPGRRAAWHAAVERFSGIPHPTLRTLVVIVETTIDVPLHCRTGLGFRLGFDGERLVARRGPDDLAANAAQVARAVGPVVFFLGAGFSHSSRMPLGNALRDSAIARLLDLGDPTNYATGELAARFFEWISEHREMMTTLEARQTPEVYIAGLTLEQVVRAEVGLHGHSRTLDDFKIHHDRVVRAPGPAVIDLSRVVSAAGTRRVLLVTVNFDQLVEEHSSVPLRVFSNDTSFASAASYLREYLAGRENDVPLLKLHGTIDEPGSCIVSTEQTERGVTGPKQDALLSIVDGSPPPIQWFYIGASMRDRDLLPLLSNATFASKVDESWVSPYLVESVEGFGMTREAFWRESLRRTIGERIVTETADAFFAALGGAWAGP